MLGDVRWKKVEGRDVMIFKAELRSACRLINRAAALLVASI
jgi:hypothetical protein